MNSPWLKNFEIFKNYEIIDFYQIIGWPQKSEAWGGSDFCTEILGRPGIPGLEWNDTREPRTIWDRLRLRTVHGRLGDDEKHWFLLIQYWHKPIFIWFPILAPFKGQSWTKSRNCETQNLDFNCWNRMNSNKGQQPNFS